MKPRGLCRWIGHRYYRGGNGFLFPAHCLRCGDDDSDPADEIEDPWHAVAWWRLWAALRKRWEDLRRWLLCRYCGRRFGRHDDDCAPF